ncbi:MAG: glycosyltransferase family 2 protein [Gemmatimonadales bacterium]
MHDSLLVTLVIPMRNEAALIVPCLESLLANTVPGAVELLVYDGDSADRSVDLVRELATRHPQIRLFPNPRRLQAAAFNAGLEQARGRYFLRADAHSLYPANYISECLRLLEETGADNVGGLQRAEGNSRVTCAIAAAVSSRFAAGDAKYRHAATAMFTDTVYLGAWRTDTLRGLGGMRADWAVNEDYELNVRLRRAGGRVYLSPTIESTYFVRGSLPKLARQYLRYGFWKVRTLVEHPGSLRWRQLAAPALIAGIAATWPLIRWLGPIGGAPLGGYLLANIIASVHLAWRTEWRNVVFLPVIFALIHCAWGVGFCAGIPYWVVRCGFTPARVNEPASSGRS